MDDMHPAERFFSAQHPANIALKIRFIAADEKELSVALEAPESFVVNPATGELHSGLATMVLDTVMGGAVMGSLVPIRPIATAGLTVQHMRRPVRGERLVCTAQAEGFHSDIAHMTGRLTTEDGEVLAIATGTFMTGTRSKPLGARV